MPDVRPPLPPFTFATATQKTRLAEDAWNSCDPARVTLAYIPDSRWRNRSEFFAGRDAIRAFLARKWATSTSTASSRSCGASMRTAPPCASSTSTTTPKASGSAPVQQAAGI